jgi:hypothetical protein
MVVSPFLKNENISSLDPEKEVISEIADIFIDEFTAPVQILTLGIDQNNIAHGTLLSGGGIYSYALNDESIAYKSEDEATKELSEYSQGLLAGYGIKTDSSLPLEYALGYFRLDAQVRCSKGGTPCGKICLPKGAVCRKYGGGKLKSGNGGKIAAGIGVGLVGGAAAAAAGGLAYANRKQLQKGGGLVAERLKKTNEEAKSELKAGLNFAKRSLKEGMKQSKEAEKTFKELEESSINPEIARGLRVNRRAVTTGVKTGAIGSAVGAVRGGVENATSVTKSNLRNVGEAIKETGKEVKSNTSRQAKNIIEKAKGLLDKSKKK